MEESKVYGVRAFNLSEVKVGMTVKTRNGMDARILATDVIGPKPIVVAVEWKESDFTEVYTCHPNGRFHDDEEDESDADLFLPLRRKSVWANLFWDEANERYFVGKCFDCKEDAINVVPTYPNARLVKTVEIPFLD